MLLPAVKMRFWQNGGQTNNSQKGQKVDRLITLRHTYIHTHILTYIHIHIHIHTESFYFSQAWVRSQPHWFPYQPITEHAHKQALRFTCHDAKISLRSPVTCWSMPCFFKNACWAGGQLATEGCSNHWLSSHHTSCLLQEVIQLQGLSSHSNFSLCNIVCQTHKNPSWLSSDGWLMLSHNPLSAMATMQWWCWSNGLSHPTGL